jgi:shikimate kinase
MLYFQNIHIIIGTGGGVVYHAGIVRILGKVKYILFAV